MPLTSRPIIWSIAASDSAGGAGIQADLKTIHCLKGHGCTLITAITAQNSLAVEKITPLSESDLEAQWQALADDLPATAIKIGLLPKPSTLLWLTKRLTLLRSQSTVFCIWDPVLKASSGASLLETFNDSLIDPLLSQLDLITPNLMEAQSLTGITIESYADIERAAQQLLTRGVNSVLIKGGHSFADDNPYCRDYFASHESSFWLSHPKQTQINNHGTGCTLATAIASFIAQQHSLSDSVVLANRYIQQSLRLARPQGQGPGPVWQAIAENNPVDLALLTYSASGFDSQAISAQHTPCFPKASPLGLYAIVDNLKDLQHLIQQGVDTLQWRVKVNTDNDSAKREHKTNLQQAISLCAQANVPLYINDDWQLALDYNAYGIHLGQEDLAQLHDSELMQIKRQGLRLGISCHTETELAYAHSLQPSYLAFGPVFSPISKQVDHPPLGLTTLKQWQNCYGKLYPTTCIGGIDASNLAQVAATGMTSVAVISALSGSATDNKRVRFIQCFRDAMNKRVN